MVFNVFLIFLIFWKLALGVVILLQMGSFIINFSYRKSYHLYFSNHVCYLAMYIKTSFNRVFWNRNFTLQASKS